MFNVKALLPTVVAVIVALIVYDMFVKGLINKYDNTLDSFEANVSNDKLKKLIRGQRA